MQLHRSHHLAAALLAGAMSPQMADAHREHEARIASARTKLLAAGLSDGDAAAVVAEIDAKARETAYASPDRNDWVYADAFERLLVERLGGRPETPAEQLNGAFMDGLRGQRDSLADAYRAAGRFAEVMARRGEDLDALADLFDLRRPPRGPQTPIVVPWQVSGMRAARRNRLRGRA